MMRSLASTALGLCILCLLVVVGSCDPSVVIPAEIIRFASPMRAAANAPRPIALADSSNYITTTEPWTKATITAVCTQITGSTTQWIRYYCALDGGSVYQVVFRDASCTIPEFGVQTSTNTLSSPLAMVTCQAYDLSPQQPFGYWPPAGWFTKQVNFNPSTQTTTCDWDDSISVFWQTKEVTPLGNDFCHPRRRTPVSATADVYNAHYCSNDGSSYGTAHFTDSACSTVPVYVKIDATGCFTNVDGKKYIYSCPAPSVAFPTTLPTISRTTYINSECDATIDPLVGPPTIDLYTDGLCFDSQVVSCEEDPSNPGDWYVNVAKYDDPTKTGQCPGLTIQDASWSSKRYKASLDSCYPTMTANGASSAMYSCGSSFSSFAAKQTVAAEEKDL